MNINRDKRTWPFVLSCSETFFFREKIKKNQEKTVDNVDILMETGSSTLSTAAVTLRSFECW